MNPVDSGRPTRTKAVAPGERGATRIADRVVAKIASQAAREALESPTPDAAPPHATVVVRPHARPRSSEGTPTETARIRVSLELPYPSDIGGQCAAVRRHVAQRVGTLAGMHVSEVAVQVERLHLAHAHDAAQGRTR
ncbi:Asp23/Gls24 family envelope stress response protein [Streptomyces sp. DSM 40750]|uniref:Asp23/Gls24 family envelope stress response protein n=1 Tax=Streptomyces sp. DSM 40750 TaxID=2801030 RepID=UPI00214C80C6|nr:Asp23/Gls24 family envelope stress response protein [Streptomyces sp. DSM 40750]UUU21044.1 Asp23/Gls24 family envelope stress response protein [Streptomyces sp. DSM 40750]